MNVRVFPTAPAAVQAAADFFEHLIVLGGLSLFMPAGGNTPLPMYAEIARRRLPLERLRVFSLDEYVGVPSGHPRSCAELIREHVVRAWRIPEAQFEALPTTADPARIKEHERKIDEAGGLDLVVLGLGRNGHLGFNEPGSLPDSPGRIVGLAPETIESNRAWFHGEFVPDRGITAGLGTILRSKQIMLLAFGIEKAAAVAAAVEGPRSPDCPASFLQGHPAVELFLDPGAASLLNA